MDLAYRLREAYGLVEVDSATKQLTIRLKDGNGAAICSFTLQAQS